MKKNTVMFSLLFISLMIISCGVKGSPIREFKDFHNRYITYNLKDIYYNDVVLLESDFWVKKSKKYNSLRHKLSGKRGNKCLHDISEVS